MSRRGLGLAGGLIGGPAVAFATLSVIGAGVSGSGAGGSTGAACGGGQAAVQPAAVAGTPAAPVAGYAGQQLAAAAQIIRAGADAGIDPRGQTIGVMTAMGESGLRPLGFGDLAGPDSRGYFQQRDPWGPLAVRVDAYGSARLFFTGGQGGQAGLRQIPGWEAMTPTHAAHAVQRNADPEYYTRYWNAAVAVVSALSGVQVDPGPGQGCTPGAGSVPAGPGGWTNPNPGATLSSGFTTRINPVTGRLEHHDGQDLAAPCGTPIYAAHDGVITKAGPSTGFGDAIFEDTGGGITVWYGHEFPAGIEVTVGQQVKAGQEIGKVGSNGQSTGCHDHYQVNIDGKPVDPVPFMAAHGAPLR